MRRIRSRGRSPNDIHVMMRIRTNSHTYLSVPDEFVSCVFRYLHAHQLSRQGQRYWWSCFVFYFIFVDNL
jgi:hypothetical protein